MPYVHVCTHVTVEFISCAVDPIESPAREDEMLAYVSRQVGQKWSMLARYAGLEEDEIQQIKQSTQDRPCAIMKKIQEKLTWNELLDVVQKHVSLCSKYYMHEWNLVSYEEMRTSIWYEL